MVADVFPKEFERKKRKMKILILGPYKPPSFEDRLRSFRDCLNDKKYDNTKLVADFPDAPRLHKNWDIHFSMKSRVFIKNWANALIFVFFKNADNSGVTSEFEFTHLKAQEKLSVSVVFNEKDLDLSTLIKGPIKVHKIYADDFEDDMKLCEKALGYCTNFVYQLYWALSGV